jgi:hypothetical protein
MSGLSLINGPFLNGTQEDATRQIETFIRQRGAGTLAVTIRGWLKLRERLEVDTALAALLERGTIDIEWPDDTQHFRVAPRGQLDPEPHDEYGQHLTERSPCPLCQGEGRV